MKRSTSRLLSTLLVLCMVLALLPGTALAAGTTVHASTVEELEAALKSNTTIILEGKDYTVNYTLNLWDLENVTIQGTTGTRIMSTSPYSDVIYVRDSKNIVLDKLVLGHDIPASEEGCQNGVLEAVEAELTVTNCDLFGCGLVGVEASSSTITVEKSTIRDCSENILALYGGVNIVFKNCVFSGNGYKEPEQYAIYMEPANMFGPGDELALYNCTFRDNKNPNFTNGSPVIENCTFINNSWSDPPSTSTTPSTPAPSPTTAYASTQTVELDGKKVEFQMYALKDANGNDTNYIKVRDLAMALKGTQAEFSVDWADGAVSLAAGKTYTPNGSENATPFSGDRGYTVPTDPTNVNGEASDLQAILLKDDAGGGFTYYKLRDLGSALGFNVGWSAERGVYIESDRPYTG